MSDSLARWDRLIHGLRSGDQQVAMDFWNQYGHMLHAVADKNLADGLRRRVGPEDVVQSACRTFLRRAKIGEFQLEDSQALWRLLCAITLTKIRAQARYHLRQKRGLNQEKHGLATDSVAGFIPESPEPTPAEAAEFADQFQQLLASLDEEERQIVDLKLQDYTHEEVAQKLGCSERTVRRIMKKLQSRLSKVFEVS